MTQEAVFKVSKDSRREDPTPAEADLSDALIPDFSAWENRELTHEEIQAIERAALEYRSRVLWLMIRRGMRAIERAVWRIRQRDMEKYLAKSTDLVDLERRIRDLERGRGPGISGLSY